MIMRGGILALLLGGVAQASPVVDEEVFGKMLGSWSEKKGRAASYEISGSNYRTWKPHISPTLDGGIFVSVRIDHLRGMLASDDHASLELSFDRQGNVATARSTIALQGRKVSSDLIQGGTKAGASLAGMDRAAKVGADLIASLSSKLLREKVSEPGRVGFPAALRHNYNLLCLAVRNVDNKAVAIAGVATDGLAIKAVPVEEVVPVEGEPEVESEGESEGEEAEDEPQEPVVPENKEKEPKSVPPLEVLEHKAALQIDLPKVA